MDLQPKDIGTFSLLSFFQTQLSWSFDKICRNDANSDDCYFLGGGGGGWEGGGNKGMYFLKNKFYLDLDLDDL